MLKYWQDEFRYAEMFLSEQNIFRKKVSSTIGNTFTIQQLTEKRGAEFLATHVLFVYYKNVRLSYNVMQSK